MALLTAYLLWMQTGAGIQWEWRAKTLDAFQHLERLVVEAHRNLAMEEGMPHGSKSDPTQVSH